MNLQFYAEANPSREICRIFSDLAPENAFLTPAYVRSMTMTGSQPFLLSLKQDGNFELACLALMRAGKMNRSLKIDSLPLFRSDRQEEIFWNALLELCKEKKISRLQINTFASARAVIPAISGETWRKQRYEFVLPLSNSNLWNNLSSNHKRNVKRAKKGNLELRQTSDEEACSQHVALMAKSMNRRKNRGEVVPRDVQLKPYKSLIQAKAGEIFQTVLENNVLSSILLLKAERGAYYHSAGTSPEGMALGASHFLIYETAKLLQSNSIEIFNLGGVDRLDSGLARFKGGFGAKIVALEAAEFFLGGKFRKEASSGINWVRNVVKGT